MPKDGDTSFVYVTWAREANDKDIFKGLGLNPSYQALNGSRHKFSSWAKPVKIHSQVRLEDLTAGSTNPISIRSVQYPS